MAGDTVKHCLTPELARLRPFPDLKARPCKEILNFPSAAASRPAATETVGGGGGISVESPHYQFRNLLYVSPKELNFSNRSGGDRARNIAVKIQLMGGEEENAALPAIFGKSNCPELSREAFTAVAHHNKCPDFYEEVRVPYSNASILDTTFCVE